MKNDHTAAELLLWPQGFQQYTPTPDNAIFEALAGDDDRVRRSPTRSSNEDDEEWEITGNRFDPGPLLRAVHHQRRRARRRVPHARASSASRPRARSRATPSVIGLRVPGRRGGRSRREFQRHLLFSLDLAESAADPANPVSHMGNTAPNFYVDAFAAVLRRPAARPGHGQARRSAPSRCATASTAARCRRRRPREWHGRRALRQGHGRLLPPPPRRRHAAPSRATRRGVVRPAGRHSQLRRRFTYRGRGARAATGADHGRRELHRPDVRTQDPSGPHYLSYYTDALDERSIDYDVYDVDAHDTTSPDRLGVLSHYEAVDLVHGRRLRHPPAGPARRHRHRALQPSTSRSTSATS